MSNKFFLTKNFVIPNEILGNNTHLGKNKNPFPPKKNKLPFAKIVLEKRAIAILLQPT